MGINQVAYAQEDAAENTINLPTIIVKATSGDQSEGTGSFKAKASRSSSKLNLSLKETPQSISVITSEQIEQRNLNNIDDILAATPGVTVTKNDSERSNYYARGFKITNQQIDGMPIGDNDPLCRQFLF